MRFFIEEMNKEMASKILGWQYTSPYDFYNNEYSVEAMAEMLDGSYRAVIDEEGYLYGFFCIGNPAQVPAGRQLAAYPEGYVDIGLGMDPARTGKGSGAEFFEFILQYIGNEHKGVYMRLTVADFNKRAIYLYEKFGFRKEKEFKTGLAEFITMVKDK